MFFNICKFISEVGKINLKGELKNKKETIKLEI